MKFENVLLIGGLAYVSYLMYRKVVPDPFGVSPERMNENPSLISVGETKIPSKEQSKLNPKYQLFRVKENEELTTYRIPYEKLSIFEKMRIRKNQYVISSEGYMRSIGKDILSGFMFSPVLWAWKKIRSVRK